MAGRMWRGVAVTVAAAVVGYDPWPCLTNRLPGSIFIQSLYCEKLLQMVFLVRGRSKLMREIDGYSLLIANLRAKLWHSKELNEYLSPLVGSNFCPNYDDTLLCFYRIFPYDGGGWFESYLRPGGSSSEIMAIFTRVTKQRENFYKLLRTLFQ